jgi:hypothetical protein
MVDKKTSDYLDIPTAEDTDFIDVARSGIGNFKISILNFIAQIKASLTKVTGGSFTLATGANITLPLQPSAVRSYRIDGLKALKTLSGTITVTIQINGVNVTGLTNLSVTSTPQSATATANNIVDVDDRVTVVYSSNASALEIELVMVAEYL